MTTRTRTPDAARAYAVLDYILAHPEQHDQGIWLGVIQDDEGNECGTVGCFAGWTCLLAGDRPSSWGGSDIVLFVDSGRQRLVHERASELLGITSTQADMLFDASNSIEELENMIMEFFGPRPESSGQPA